MSDGVTRAKVNTIFVVTFWSLLAGFIAALPQERWSAAWGNFFGAAIVAAGGLIGCLEHAAAVPEKAKTWSWALVAVGGCVIAGASLQMALAPST